MSMAWMADKACGPADTDLFFPAESSPGMGFDYGPALAICERCEVRPACFAWAVANGDIRYGKAVYGVIGGVAPAGKRGGRPRTAERYRRAG